MHTPIQKQSPKAIIIDDEPAMLSIYSQTLTSYGYIVDTANNGSEADFKITHNVYDIIITDLNMPYMDGLELVKNIREGKTNHKTPIVVISGYLSKNAVVRLASFQISKIFTKPVNPKELIEFVNKSLNYEQFGKGNTKTETIDDNENELEIAVS